MFKVGALVSYKGKPAKISAVTTHKYDLSFSDGSSRKVREKDFRYIHPSFVSVNDQCPLADMSVLKDLQLPREIWERLTWFWSFGFIGIAVINAYFVNVALSARQRFLDSGIPVPEEDISKFDCSQTLLEDLCLSAQQTMDTWVNFKLFGTLGLTLLLIVITVVILSKNIKERESGV